MAFNLDYAKSIFASTTFWGSVVSLVSLLFPHVFANLVGSANQQTVVTVIGGIVGFLVTVYGRFTAKQVVTVTGGPIPPATPLSGTKG